MIQKVLVDGPTTLIRGIPVLNSFISAWEDIYGGKIVEDDLLSSVLQRFVDKWKAAHDGKVQDVLHVQEFPNEQFWPVEIDETHPITGRTKHTGLYVFFKAPKLFFVKR